MAVGGDASRGDPRQQKVAATDHRRRCFAEEAALVLAPVSPRKTVHDVTGVHARRRGVACVEP